MENIGIMDYIANDTKMEYNIVLQATVQTINLNSHKNIIICKIQVYDL